VGNSRFTVVCVEKDMQVMIITIASLIIIIIIIIIITGDIGTINSNDRIAATMYSLGTWFVSGIYV
jgi:hypothetical protein